MYVLIGIDGILRTDSNVSRVACSRATSYIAATAAVVAFILGFGHRTFLTLCFLRSGVFGGGTDINKIRDFRDATSFCRIMKKP